MAEQTIKNVSIEPEKRTFLPEVGWDDVSDVLKNEFVPADFVVHGEFFRAAVGLHHEGSFHEQTVVGVKNLLQQDDLRGVRLAGGITELKLSDIVQLFDGRREADLRQQCCS